MWIYDCVNLWPCVCEFVTVFFESLTVWVNLCRVVWIFAGMCESWTISMNLWPSVWIFDCLYMTVYVILVLFVWIFNHVSESICSVVWIMTVCVNIWPCMWICDCLCESLTVWVNLYAVLCVLWPCMWIYDRVCVLVIFFLLPSLYKVYQVLMPNHDVW